MDSKQLMDLILNAEQRHKECAKRVRETDRSKQIRAESFERMRDYKSGLAPISPDTQAVAV